MSDGSGMALGIKNFPHLTRIEWEALHRLTDVSGDFAVTSLLSSATAEQQRQAAQEFIERVLTDVKRRVSTPSHSSRNDDGDVNVLWRRSKPTATESLVAQD